jgi:hypothetical protein
MKVSRTLLLISRTLSLIIELWMLFTFIVASGSSLVNSDGTISFGMAFVESTAAFPCCFSWATEEMVNRNKPVNRKNLEIDIILSFIIIGL